jgi:hypothetical protein
MAARAALGPLPGYVHVYFHDTDLLRPGRVRALETALTVLGRRCRAVRLDELSAEVEVEFATATSAR